MLYVTQLSTSKRAAIVQKGTVRGKKVTKYYETSNPS